MDADQTPGTHSSPAIGQEPWPFWFTLLPVITTPAILLYTLVRAARDKEFRQSLRQRFFLGFRSGKVKSNGRLVWWIHAASLGEFQGAKPVLKEIRAHFPNAVLVVTTTSETGRAAAADAELADHVLFFPMDIPIVVRRALDVIQPDVVLVFETELWPCWVREISKRRIPLFLVNGRISDKTTGRYFQLRSIFRPVLSAFRRIDVQTELDSERFELLCPSLQTVRVTGSTKYDQPPIALEPDEKAMFLRDFSLPEDGVVLTLGSIRPGEEEEVLAAALLAQEAFPELSVIVCPRHEQRFEAVAEMLRKRGVSFARRSTQRNQGPFSMLLVDTYGELVRAYSVSDLAFVGGTISPIGGHNPVEPALCGAVVFVGPETANIRDAVSTLRSEGALVQVQNGEELLQQLKLFCGDEVLRFSARSNARRASERYSGLSRKLVEEIANEIDNSSTGSAQSRFGHLPEVARRLT